MEKQYISTSQLRGYQTLRALFGYETSGIECAELAKQLGHTKSQVYKDLSTLEVAGLAEQLPDKKWRVSAALGREAVKIMNNVNSARMRVEETAERYGVMA